MKIKIKNKNKKVKKEDHHPESDVLVTSWQGELENEGSLHGRYSATLENLNNS